MTGWRRAVWVVLIVVSCVGSDHLTKGLARTYLASAPIVSMADDSVRLHYAVNQGAVFNFEDRLPAGWQGFPCTVGVAACGGLLLAFLLFGPALRPVPMTALCLVAGGLLSNLLDRVLLGGSIVDFLSIGWGPVRSQVFNLADVALVGGTLLFVCSVLWRFLLMLSPRATGGRSKPSVSPQSRS